MFVSIALPGAGVEVPDAYPLPDFAS